MAIDVGKAIGYLDLDTSGFNKGFTSAFNDLQIFKDQSATVQDKLSAVGDAFHSVGKSLTTGVTLPLVGIGTIAAKTTADFDSAMSQIQATLGLTADSTSELNGETVNTMDSLRNLAREMGESTKFSASEAAAAINNMAMAGYDTNEIFSALPEVLNLAAAGGIDLDYATQLAANGLNVMGLGVDSLREMSDKLAVTASSAYGSVSDFGEGLLVAGGQAKLANLDLTDTFTALGILGDAGISASEGGTYLRNTLKNLYTPTDDARMALEELGIETANEDGTLRDFQTVLQELGTAMDSLSEEDRITAMSRIFDTRTIAAASALIKDSGDRWDELSGKIDNASGASQNMADTQLNNLSGQLTILKSSLEGLMISIGDILMPLISTITEKIQEVVNWMNSLDESQKERIVKILEIVATIGPLLLIISKVISIITSIISVIKTVTTVIGALNAVMMANPIVLIIAAIAALVAAFVLLWNNCEEFREFWINLWEGIKKVATDVWEAISSFFSEIWGTISSVASDIWNGVTSFFSDTWNGIKETASNVWGGIKDFFSNTWNGIKETASTVYNKIKDNIEETNQRTKENWEKVWTGVKGFFSNAWDGIKDTASKAYNKVKDSIVETSKKNKENWEKAWGGIKNFFANSWDSMKNTLNEKFPGLGDKIQGFATDIYNWFSELPGKLLQIGKDLINGLWDGISAAWDWVSEKVSGIAESVTGVFKDIFGIASPSKVMRSQGDYLMQGLAEGMEDSLGLVKDQVNDVAGTINDTLNSALNTSRTLNLNAAVDPSQARSAVKMIQANAATRGSDKHTYTENNYTFNSPKAVTPTVAAKLLRQTAQQMSLNFT